jgi:hypothetical protein
MKTLKIVAATLVVVGIVLGFLNLYYAPHNLILNSSPNRPSWLPWLSWLVTAASAFLYIIADYYSRK